MRTARLRSIFNILIATMGIGAKAPACGSCPEASEQLTVTPFVSTSVDAGAIDAADANDASDANDANDADTIGAETIDATIADTGSPPDAFAVTCSRYCAGGGAQCAPTTLDGGPAIECRRLANSCGGAGRRPSGLPDGALGEGDAFACFLAETARLEAASIDAFRILRHDLAAHGAPRALLRAASRAARDERRHARTMRGHARRHGGRVSIAVVASPGSRSLEEIARENAVEGCVRETFAALVATLQATRARDLHLRAAMVRIARDETRHAALALQVDAWLCARLDPGARRRVETARRHAMHQLSMDRSAEVSGSVLDRAGLPRANEASWLAARLFANFV
jgi:hypothetical protein